MFKRRRKFDFKSKKYFNPFFRQRRKRHLRHLVSFRGWRFKLFFLLTLTIISGFFWFLCLSSYFDIKQIEVVGAKRVPNKTIEDLAREQLQERRFLIGLQKNINLFNDDKFIELLRQYYFLDDIIIDKDWPDKIVINIAEKEPLAVWYEMERYYFIDNEGNIISEADPIQIIRQDYPLIDNRGELKILNKQVKIEEETLVYISKLFGEIQDNYKDFNIDRFILDNDINTVKLILINGPQLYFNTLIDMNEQINKLILIREGKLKENFKNKKYIDLRYGDRVYYE